MRLRLTVVVAVPHPSAMSMDVAPGASAPYFTPRIS